MKSLSKKPIEPLLIVQIKFFSIKLKINLVEQNLVNLIHIIVKSLLNNFLVDTEKLELYGIVLF